MVNDISFCLCGFDSRVTFACSDSEVSRLRKICHKPILNHDSDFVSSFVLSF